MTIADLLREAAAKLKEADIEEPRFEATLLLAHALRAPRETLIADPASVVKSAPARRFSRAVARRCAHEPFAYIVGEKWFYGRPFIVTKDTLIPRPATETMVEAVLSDALRIKGRGPINVLDIGTGSGAIGLTLAAELPKARVTCIDVSPKALALARRNAKRLGLAHRVRFVRLDILKKPTGRNALGRAFFPRSGTAVVVANLPYLPEHVWRKTMPDVRRFEPKIALASGPDGLRHYRALMRRLAEAGAAPELLLLEAEPYQMRMLKRIVRAALPAHAMEVRKDLHGDARLLIAKGLR